VRILPLLTSMRKTRFLVRKAKLAAFLLLVTFLLSLPSTAISADFSLFKDPDDGMFDASNFILSRVGFMPVPIIITEPAVGAGVGLAIAYFHDKMGQEKPAEDGTRRSPSSISVGAGGITENDSWFAGGGHIGYWKDDTIRYVGLLGKADLNLEYFVADRPVSFNIDGLFLQQELKFRVGDSNFFLGAGYTLVTTEAAFDISGVIPGVDEFQLDSNNAKVSFIGYYDSRDNTFTPNTGQQIELKVSNFNETWGGDFNYWHTQLEVQSFHLVHPRLVLGVKANAENVTDGAPFYALPFVSLRGVQAMRYQGDSIMGVELEARWALTPRVSLIGFAGTGWVDSDKAKLKTNDDIITGGGGIRYMMAKKLDIHVGIDIAQGPEQTVLYLQVGSAW